MTAADDVISTSVFATIIPGKKAFYFLLGWCQGHADRRLNAKIDHLQLFQIQLFG